MTRRLLLLAATAAAPLLAAGTAVAPAQAASCASGGPVQGQPLDAAILGVANTTCRQARRVARAYLQQVPCPGSCTALGFRCKARLVGGEDVLVRCTKGRRVVRLELV